MTGLLVSVRSGVEAASAVAGGAQVIDIKEPSRGSLGPADPLVWRDVCCRVGDSNLISAALGELLEDSPADRLNDLGSICLVKTGLAGCNAVDDWRERWQSVVARLPSSVGAVAVAYADHVRAGSPNPDEILTSAVELGCRTLLIDTFDKSHGSLFDIMSAVQVGRIVQAARSLSLRVVLAGSLNHGSIERALRFKPDLIAVRGAACDGSRTGPIDRARVRALAELVAGTE